MMPFPLAADDHQRKNAEALQKAGAARMILQKDLSGETLASEIRSLLSTPEKLNEKENAARKLARRDAAEKTVDLMEELIGSRQYAESRRLETRDHYLRSSSRYRSRFCCLLLTAFCLLLTAH